MPKNMLKIDNQTAKTLQVEFGNEGDATPAGVVEIMPGHTGTFDPGWRLIQLREGYSNLMEKHHILHQCW